MDSATNNLIVAVVRPPLLALRYLLRGLHSVLFAWWLDRHLVTKADRRLEKEIVDNMEFLFSEFDGRIIPNDRDPPASFDFAAITIRVHNLLLRFTSGLGSLGVHVSRQQAPHEWHELSAVLSLIDNLPRKPFLFWTDVAQLLKVHLRRIEEMFSDGPYRTLSQHLQELRQQDRAITHQREAEINRKLYS